MTPTTFARSAAIHGLTALLALLPVALACATQSSNASLQKTAVSRFADGDETVTAPRLPASCPRLVGSSPRLLAQADGRLQVERLDVASAPITGPSTRDVPRASRDKVVLRI